mgnify:CR=1 FL=1
MNYPVVFDQFTDDEIERQQLKATYVEPTSQSDPYHEEVQQLAQQLTTLSRAMPFKHRQIVEMFYRGHTKVQIIEKLHTSYPTINKVIESPKGVRLFALLAQMSELKGGPTMEARRAMVWRIAVRAEHRAPSVALKALDILNKQAGDYVPEELAQDAGTHITIKEFKLIANQPVKEVIETDSPIEGEFQPITVDIDG